MDKKRQTLPCWQAGMALWLVALPIERQTTALWLVFLEDLEEAAEMLAER